MRPFPTPGTFKIFDSTPVRSPLRSNITSLYLADETKCVERLLTETAIDNDTQRRIEGRARRLVQQVREKGRLSGGIDAFLHQYDLSSQEGVVLMCLAEALLRIPDDGTADRLIQDKLGKGEWEKHFGQSHSLFVNASTWGLMLTGRLVKPEHDATENVQSWLKRLIAHSGEPVIRLAMRQAMRILGHQFVMGQTIEEALKRSRGHEHSDYRHSFDMLGEAALTRADAERYFESYSHAIDTLSGDAQHEGDLISAPSISVKLSALHPRYQFSQRSRVAAELTPKLLALAQRAKAKHIALTVDAEESDRLELSLDLFESAFSHPSLAEWNGLGLAVQAYQTRAVAVLDWFINLARQYKKRIPIRLVKGAYWDTEIKRAQEQGLRGYPVFTRKASTDVSYLACVKRLFAASDAVYPQFATHNAHSIAWIVELAGGTTEFEFQRLHGMGEALYEEVMGSDMLKMPCRVYAPVGGHKELLPYLVRRLLENGANTSFVNRIVDENIAVETIIADSIEKTRATQPKPHPNIPLPRDLYGNQRKNAQGINLNDEQSIVTLAKEMADASRAQWFAQPITVDPHTNGDQHDVVDPSDHRRIIGSVAFADEQDVDKALTHAAVAAPQWNARGAEERARCLEQAAELLEEHRGELMALCIREAGKTIPDALAEVREAADFCRYYASSSRRDFARPTKLDGPTGEINEISLHGRGVFACISPWNFPLAIFVGQIAAALAAGNAVIAKPAGQTPIVAVRAVQLFHGAGVPIDVLQVLPGRGSVIGTKLAADPRVGGIAFTGSTETARTINETLATRGGPIIPFIAETGGQNAMIVDSSALPDQIVVDAIQSAFNSAGQRCSALRVMFVQEDVTPRVLELLAGAMNELKVGDPSLLSTDVGPVIDDEARKKLIDHVERMNHAGDLIARTPVPDELTNGSFFAPHAFQIPDLSVLQREIFGPILHVISYAMRDLDTVIDTINGSGYGLTLGIHSRIDATVSAIQSKARVGNIYVNRNMIGAVVGVQPFGGEGLSGTGPKAGGPYYLHRFATERTVSVNTAALGGNTSLLALNE